MKTLISMVIGLMLMVGIPITTSQAGIFGITVDWGGAHRDRRTDEEKAADKKEKAEKKKKEKAEKEAYEKKWATLTYEERVALRKAEKEK